MQRIVRLLSVMIAVTISCQSALAQRPPARPSPQRPRPAQRPAQPPVQPPLSERLSRLLDAEPFNRALWGVVVADQRGRILFERNGDRLFVPASGAKLVVAATAAALLPPDFRFRTAVYAAGEVADSQIRGDLVLYGRGDPTLSARYYPSMFTALEELADSLLARGIRLVAGDVVGDASYFDSATTHPSWQASDLDWWYAAPVTALGFNDNSVNFRIAPAAPGENPAITFEPDLGMVSFTNRARTVLAGQPRTLSFHRRPGTNEVWAEGDVPSDAQPRTEYVSVLDPPAYAARAFRRALESRGIHVGGGVRSTFDSLAYAGARRRAPALAEHLSPPLADILRPILETSQNWFAEMLLKTLGRERLGEGSWRAGLMVERRFLIDSLGVDSTMFSLAEGSGLSTGNLLTPRAVVRLLARMRAHPRAAPFLEALAVAGTTGTLRLRFRDTRLVGRVRAKTGSIEHVNTLSGYLELDRGRSRIFSIQINNHAALNREALARIDSVVVEVGR